MPPALSACCRFAGQVQFEQSSYVHLQDMITDGMAGIAYVGGDICGFQKIATEELCARWAAAGAWQPFARNHHADGFQEFYL